MNNTFLKACRGEKVDYTPVWMMRQAGRYLPDYQRVRGTVTFLELCKNPELACEVTLQPVDILGVDAAILFSDILIPLEAMGLVLEFHEKRGPVFPDPVRTAAAVDRLRIPDPEADLAFVLNTIRLLRRELANKVPLIGFAGAPFTLATYLIEGGSSKFFFETKKMMYTAPELYCRLLDKITACTSRYLKAQAVAGAQALQIFDSWAGILGPDDFAQYALPYVQSIIADLRQVTDIPIIYFANNGATLLAQSKSSGADVLGLDWRIDIADAARQVGDAVALQGNLDPCALLLPREEMAARIKKILAGGRLARGHVCNLGHGILPETPPAQAKLFIDLVHELSAA
ncbi:MAG: uroporphyrinogen decarboxylase [Deltaproteobacteria bacterium RIFOXYD12_FULL_57_12]|nr:MAG: uroporphyrinogen decarboxylase [Deltaproteobacteria bacterium RIFOXYD12_FULL_57_12]